MREDLGGEREDLGGRGGTFLEKEGFPLSLQTTHSPSKNLSHEECRFFRHTPWERLCFLRLAVKGLEGKRTDFVVFPSFIKT